MSELFPYMRALVCRFAHDERGVVSIIGLVLIILGLGFSVLVLDVGHLYLTKRRLQASVDAAALAAVGDPTTASQAVTQSLARNGYEDTTATIEVGAYTPDPNIPAGQRFNPNPDAQQNAVRITKSVTIPGFLTNILGITALSTVRATATASHIPLVSFSIGTGLADIDAGALNSVLSGLLGTTITLQLVNYQALASTNVDALTFLDQLAVHANATAGTYGDLANTSITMGDLIVAAKAALNIHPAGNNSAAIDALNLISLSVPQNVSAAIGALIDTTLWQNRQIGSILQQTPGTTSLNILSLVTAMAQIYGAGHLINLNSAISVPVTNTSVVTQLSVGSSMASASVGSLGTSISTSQVRLSLVATVANLNLGIASAAITLPIYLQIASGQAKVVAISCRPDAMATIAATTQAASAQIGTVIGQDLTNFGNSPPVQPAQLVALNVLGIPVSITASGALTVAAGPAQNLDFSQTDIASGAVKTTAASDAGHIFSGLINTLTINTTLLSDGGLLTNTINATLNTIILPLIRPVLTAILTALDPAVDTLLKTLGLRLGTMDVTVHGVSCGAPTLVS
jgi:uncharacterized membrane protein